MISNDEIVLKPDETFLTPLNNASDIMYVVKDDLYFFSGLLHQVGNDKLSNDMLRLAAKLDRAIDELKRGTDTAFNAYLKSVNDGSLNMVKAALAGAGVDPRKVFKDDEAAPGDPRGGYGDTQDGRISHGKPED